jgi:hypothetical protein
MSSNHGNHVKSTWFGNQTCSYGMNVISKQTKGRPLSNPFDAQLGSKCLYLEFLGGKKCMQHKSIFRVLEIAMVQGGRATPSHSPSKIHVPCLLPHQAGP